MKAMIHVIFWSVLFILLSIFSCAQNEYDMNIPWEVNIDSGLQWTIGKQIKPIFSEALSYFGGTITDGHSIQMASFHLASSCESSSNEAGFVQNNEIYLCDKVIRDSNLLVFVVFHESGHMLGQKLHRPCESKGIMSPFVSCARDNKTGAIIQSYQNGDPEWIAAGGLIINLRLR